MSFEGSLEKAWQKEKAATLTSSVHDKARQENNVTKSPSSVPNNVEPENVQHYLENTKAFIHWMQLANSQLSKNPNWSLITESTEKMLMLATLNAEISKGIYDTAHMGGK